MITIDGKQFPGLSFKQDQTHRIMVTYRWDGELSFLFCESPLSRKIYDDVHAAIKEQTDGCGRVDNITFWSQINTTGIE
jgi:hypothetical protein